MDAIETVQRIEQDFEQGHGPFSDVEFPESRLVREIKVQAGDSDEPITLSMEDRARLAAFFSTLDYNRDANQLVDKLLELHERKPKWFDPYSVPMSETAIEEVFKEIGFRYGSRDAHAWYTNCEILRNKYHGRVTEVILASSSNAPDFVQRLRDDDFLCLTGDKIAPMFARILNDEVAPLDNMWQLDIPVDTWVRKITQEITGSDMSDDDIRAWWGVVGEKAGVSRHVVDGGVWQIGNNLNEWGEDYLKEVADIEEFEYL